MVESVNYGDLVRRFDPVLRVFFHDLLSIQLGIQSPFIYRLRSEKDYS